MTDEWRDIPGWEGLYQVSSEGEVRSLDRIRKDSLGRVRRDRSKVLSPGGNKHRRVTLYRGDVQETFTIHRLVALAFLPNPESKTHVLHRDDNPRNNSLANLSWGDDLSNRLDSLRNARVEGGSLPREDIPRIKSRVLQGERQVVIAREYGVHPSMISKIVNGKARKND